jgi:hypothetical protein
MTRRRFWLLLGRCWVRIFDQYAFHFNWCLSKFFSVYPNKYQVAPGLDDYDDIARTFPYTYLGRQKAFHYFPEDVTDAVIFGEMFSVIV